MRPPIYTPSGAALEYAEYGLNIYDSCPHGCTYCYARTMAARFGKPWGDTVTVRPGLMDALRKQLAGKEWRNAGRLVHLCFTCDPYPCGHDSTTTREVIRAIKGSGNHVQILTKGDETAQRDFDLLNDNDWFGVSLTGGTGGYAPELSASRSAIRRHNLESAHKKGIHTWVSCEPVVNPRPVFVDIELLPFVNLWRIGKLNHQKSDIDWRQFGHDAIALCKRLGRNYVIKNDLRKAMEA